MVEKENYDRIPFPDKLVNWFDIAKGLGHAAFHLVADQLRHETPSDHFTQPLERYDTWDLEAGLSPVQKEANEWVEKIGFGND